MKTGITLSLLLVTGLACNPETTPQPDAAVTALTGTYSLTSETGDSCERLTIDSTGQVWYQSWYCGEGGEAPEPIPLTDVKAKGTSLTASLPDGNQFSTDLSEWDRLNR